MSFPQSSPGPAAPKLGAALRQRHVTMIALGGIIGAGLFVGSSATLGSVGPAACLSYLVAGIVVLIMHIPGAADIMNAIVRVAVLSALNSGLYVSSRILFRLAERSDAPGALLKLTPHKVPRMGVASMEGRK